MICTTHAMENGNHRNYYVTAIINSRVQKKYQIIEALVDVWTSHSGLKQITGFQLKQLKANHDNKMISGFGAKFLLKNFSNNTYGHRVIARVTLTH